MEKYITFSAPIKKERVNDKSIIYKLKFIDSYRFMPDSLSNLVDNLSGIDEKEPEHKFIDNMRSMMASLSQSIDKVSEIDKKISQIDKKEPENKFIDNMRSIMASLSQSIDEVSEIDRKISQIKLIKKFPNTYQLSNNDPNKFSLLLRKGVYPYEYMYCWERFDEEPLLDRKHYYSKLNKEGATDEDYVHIQRVCKVFKIKDLGGYHDLYV